jgi:glycerophosphoryl diester phosphodiesterase
VEVIAHRGLRMLALENSIDAVRECGVDFIEWAEVDVRLTKDGQHVVIHDETVDATTNGQGRVADLTLAELRRFDSGARFAPRFANTRLATLNEMLDVAKGRVNLLLDCKQIDPATLVHDIQAAGMESQVVVFGRPELLQSVRQAAGSTLAILAKFDPRETSIQALAKQMDPAAVEIDAPDVTPELCREIHALGIKVLANALGAEADVPAVWTDLTVAEVDWIQTDDPVGLRFCEVRRRIPQFPVQIACHRGANRYAPENTLPAIRAAADIGADYIEIDIRTTRDGAFVLVHDRTLDRTTSGSGPVNEQTSASIAALDAGTWFGAPFAGLRVPSLDEGLDALGPHAHAYLDAKDIAPESLLAAARAHGLMSRHAVYQSVDYCRRLKALDPT